MNLSIPFDVEMKGQASSTYTADQINQRLLVLKGQRATEETKREIEYLEKLRMRNVNDSPL